MVVEPASVGFYYSGGAAKSTPTGDQGGAKSSVQVLNQDRTTTPFTKNTKWQNVTATQRSSGVTQYHCFYVQNNGAQTISNLKMWFDGGESTIGPGTVNLGYSGLAPNTQEQFITSTLTQLYDVPTSSSYSSIGDGDREQVGQYIANANGNLYGKIITRAELFLERVGNPTGTLGVAMRKWSDPENVIETIGSRDVTTIATSPTVYVFENTGATHVTEVEDYLAVKFVGQESSSNYIRVYRRADSPIANSHLVNYDGSQMRNVSDYDIAGSIYTSGSGAELTAPTGITFTKPITRAEAISLPNLTAGQWVGFWERRRYGSSSSSATNVSSQIVLEYTSPE